MATTCDRCGFRDNEVKAGSGMEAKGKKIILKITDPSDLSRDILKVRDWSIFIWGWGPVQKAIGHILFSGKINH